MSRRAFAGSACGMAGALWAINRVACGGGSSDGAVYEVDDGMLEPRRVPPVEPRRYEGPRTPRAYLTHVAREERERRAARERRA